MNVRLLAAVCGLALLGSELSGCASTAKNTRADEVAAEAMNLEAFPQIVLSNAPRPEVKSVAMGAARSKGWIISRSTEDRLIVQRPLDADALANLAAGAAFKPGALLEITSYFVEQSGDTKVATKAELVAPAVGDKPALRTDYTENFQDSLTESLSSLRESWSENRNRLARATPPAEGFKDAWSKDAPPVDSRTIREPTRPVAPPPVAADPPVEVADAEPTDPPVEEQENSATDSEMTPVARPPVRPLQQPTPVISVIPPTPKPKPQQSPPAAVNQAVTPPVAVKVIPASPAKPVVAAKPAPAKPVISQTAPKLAATPALPSAKPASKPPISTTKTPPPAKPLVAVAGKPAPAKPVVSQPAAKPAPKLAATKEPAKSPVKTVAKGAPVVDATPRPKPPAPKSNGMMELPKSKSAVAGSVSFAAQAETFAKQRGCKVGSRGTDLVESRKDGEIHKVPCVGADSVLVKCQKGSCKGLL